LPQAGPAPEQPAGEAGIPTRNALITTMPAVAGMAPGTEFEFTLRGEFCTPLHQASGRIVYDPAVVQPLAVRRGELIPAGAVYLAKLDVTGFVPFAFTALPGDAGIAPGRGELLRVRFRLLAEPPPGFRIRLLNDAAYLQLRTSGGGRLSFDLASEVVPQ